MNGAPKPTTTTRTGRRLRVSILAALTGWGAFLLFALLMCLLSLGKSEAGPSPWVVFLLMGIGSGVVVFAVWLVVLMPLALLIPDDSVLWKPNVLALLGAFAGPIIVCAGAIYQLKSNSTITIYNPTAYIMGGIIFPGIPSALIGGVTGLMAARLHQWLLKKEAAAVELSQKSQRN